MAYARPGYKYSDVYVYHDIDFHLRCVGCGYETTSYALMIQHLRHDQLRGLKVPAYAFQELMNESEKGDLCCDGSH